MNFYIVSKFLVTILHYNIFFQLSFANISIATSYLLTENKKYFKKVKIDEL